MTPLEKSLVTLLLEVEQMRQAQRHYFATRTGLQAVQRLEAKVDGRIAKAKEKGYLNQPETAKQKEMFDADK